MNQVKVRLSNSLHEQMTAVAEQEGVTTDQFIGMAIAEKIATLKTVDYLNERAKRGSHEKLLAVLAKAPDVEPDGCDKR